MDNLNLIIDLLASQEIDEGALQWVNDKLQQVKNGQSSKDFYIAFSSAYRYVPKDPVKISPAMQQKLEKIYPAFEVSGWTADQLCRLAFMLALNPENNKPLLENLFTTAEVNELIVLYKSLYFLENAAEFSARAAEGIRTNMTSVFDAIALHNPFPHKYLNEEAWNQMVLKAIFMQRPVYKIYGIDERSNASLAAILLDFAHERWAAGRAVSPELWRMTTKFMNEEVFTELKKVVETGAPVESHAAIKTLSESGYAPAIAWLESRNINKEDKSWDEIGRLAEG